VLVSGIALFVGVMGATLAGVPLRWGVDAFGWRAVMAGSAVLTAVLAFSIWHIVRDDPAERGFASYYPRVERTESPQSMVAQVREVLSYRNTWLLFFAPGAFSGIVLTFAGLWGVPFLVTQHGFSVAEAAATASAMLVAWSGASMVYGPVSERIGRRKPIYLGGLAVTMILWTLVISLRKPGGFMLVALLIAVGISSAAFILTFAFAKESVPARLGGSATGIANMGVMLGGMVMQPLVGYVLDHRWLGQTVEGARLYDFAAYRWGFSLLLAWGAVSLVLIALARESYCRPLR
jgi:sugar phosphate permease